MKKILKTLLSTRGDVLGDTYISLFFAALVLFAGFITFGGMSKKFTLMQTSDNVKRIIETEGKFDMAERQKITDYLNNQNLSNVSVTVTPQKDTYSLNEQFTVSLSDKINLGSAQVPFTVPINGHAEGRCEVYSK